MNRSLILFVLLLAALIVADLTLQGGKALLFLARDLLDLVDYLAFWH